MSRYSIKVDGNLIKFKAESQRDAILKAYLISPFYSELKPLPSRLWYLIHVVAFGLGFYGAQML